MEDSRNPAAPPATRVATPDEADDVARIFFGPACFGLFSSIGLFSGIGVFFDIVDIVIEVRWCQPVLLEGGWLLRLKKAQIEVRTFSGNHSRDSPLDQATVISRCRSKCPQNVTIVVSDEEEEVENEKSLVFFSVLKITVTRITTHISAFL